MLFQQKFYMQIFIRVHLISIIVKGAAMCYQLVYIFSIFTQFVKKKKKVPSLSWHDLHAILDSGDILYNSLWKSEQILLLISDPTNHVKFTLKYSSYVKKIFVGSIGITENSGLRVSLETCFNRTSAGTEKLMLCSFHIRLLCR